MQIDGVDFGPAADLARLARTRLNDGTPGPWDREDRTQVDWLKRAYRQLLQGDPSAAERLSRGIAGVLGGGNTSADSMVLRFFGDFPTAAGGERLQQEVATRLDRWPEGLEDPIPGGWAQDLRAQLVRVALDWRTDRPADAVALDVAKKEALVPGRAGSIVASLWLRDRAWVDGNLDRIVQTSPDAAGALFQRMVDGGQRPEDALQWLLARIPASAKGDLKFVVRLKVRDPVERDRLLALLA